MAKVPFFKQIIEHERTSQDGIKVLYGMLCICHPRLVKKSKKEPPTLQTNGSLFSFIRKYTNYIESKRITNRAYTEIEQLSFIMSEHILFTDYDNSASVVRVFKNRPQPMT